MAGAPINVLALNCGSSSLKFGLYCVDGQRPSVICDGEAEEIGRPHAQFWFRRAQEDKQKRATAIADHQAAFHLALQAMKDCGAPDPDASGHRFVHGGPKLRAHQRADAETIRLLEAAMPFAPLHMPAALAVLEEATARMSGSPQVICLDTAFHRTMRDVSRNFALSEETRKLGVERFGFHGLSIESILGQLETIPHKLVIAHLGNGCSISAIENGRSMDTTMGLTPTGGIMMGTRSGDLDPGALLFLMDQGYGDRQRLSALVDHESGLLGVSGTTSDVRELNQSRKTDGRADLALRMFTYQVTKAIGSMAAALGGLDKLIFAGGIGENNAQMREEVSTALAFLGPFETQVVASDEDRQIASICSKLLST